jgi:hypothetical protein
MTWRITHVAASECARALTACEGPVDLCCSMRNVYSVEHCVFVQGRVQGVLCEA